MGIQKEYTVTVDRHSNLYLAFGEEAMVENFSKLFGGMLAKRGLSLIAVKSVSTSDDSIFIACTCETEPNPFITGYVCEE